jgi:hypothetical protein
MTAKDELNTGVDDTTGVDELAAGTLELADEAMEDEAEEAMELDELTAKPQSRAEKK